MGGLLISDLLFKKFNLLVQFFKSLRGDPERRKEIMPAADRCGSAVQILFSTFRRIPF